jgi:cytochrome c oxidase assembly protein subunit 15
MSSHVSSGSSRSDILAVGFGTTVTMWAVGYFCRIPPATVPSWLLLFLLLLCLLGGGYVIGRSTMRGPRGGLWVGLLTSVLNLLILGSLLGGDEPNQVVPSALWWLPGALIVGGALGTLGAWLGTQRRKEVPDPAVWPGRFAWVATSATVFLLLAGGLVTSHEAGLAVVDWPNSEGYGMFLYPLARMTGGIYFEHAHRLIGSLVGLTTLVLALHIQFIDRRPAVRRLAWLALVMVIIQGLMGGLRVTGRFTFATSPEETQPNVYLAVAHGVFGQLFLAVMVTLASVSTKLWRSDREPTRRANASTDRFLSTALAGLVAAQLLLGALVRHLDRGLQVHVTVAVFVLIIGMFASVRAWGLNEDQPVLRRVGRLLIIAVAVQFCLGFVAWIVTGATRGILPRPTIDVVFTTLHQMGGAAVVGLSTGLMIWSRRLLEPREHSAAVADLSFS